jgi:2-polyprenyl-3-methyl-5-hydroxy-6-metoxy-1,4-benzoquinol methylase
MKWETRSYQKELLDADNIPFMDILKTMQDLNKINTLLGGHRITCKGLGYFLRSKPAITRLNIAEIGCGGGDNLEALRKFLSRKNLSCSLTGIDIKEECIQYSKQQGADDIIWICSDYKTVNWPSAKPDIIFSSLFCHHFTDEELVEQLLWLRATSNMGFFINDLHRHPLAYYSITLLTKIFSKSYLVKNDGPVSVLRGFKKQDWIRLLKSAGITNYSIEWHWAFRYLICINNEQQR